MIAVTAINTKTNVEKEYPTLAHAKRECIPQSAKTGYTFRIINTQTRELIGNIRPNHLLYRTRANPERKLTARFIRND